MSLTKPRQTATLDGTVVQWQHSRLLGKWWRSGSVRRLEGSRGTNIDG